MSPQLPPNALVAIVGATGTGKSKLAIELAKCFNGEIINGDAMQMYKGLPITTNKISEAERQEIPHWIFDQIGLEEQPWTVNKFRRETHKKVRDIRSRGRLPILVGGTHYYAEAVLFNDRSSLGADSDGLSDGEGKERIKDAKDAIQKWPILEAPTSEILTRLREVDPQMANSWHPRDRRKIQRSLEIWLQTGKTASQTYDEQRQRRVKVRRASNDSSTSNDSMQFDYSSLIFWLRVNRDVLKRRLDDRVDSMLASGLIQEAQEITSQESKLNDAGITLDKKKGIWTSIGYKEMEPYLSAIDDPTKTPTELEQIKSSCVEDVKTATRNYARHQEGWIRNRLSTGLLEAGTFDTLYPLDSTETEQPGWSANVSFPATQTVSAFLASKNLPSPTSISKMARETIDKITTDLDHTIIINNNNNTTITRTAKDNNNNDVIIRECRPCDICNKVMMTEREWKLHMASRSHHKAVTGKRKWEAFQAWKAKQASTSGGENRVGKGEGKPVGKPSEGIDEMR